MAFMTKTDSFGIAKDGIVLSDTAENKSINTVEARGEDGFVVAVESYGERKNPTCNYEVTKDVTLSGVVLGEASGTGTTRTVLSSITITTGAGAVPTIAATGTEVPADAILQNGCKVTLDDIAIEALHHAQLFASIAFSGTGAHLTQSTYTIGGDLSLAEVDGVIKAYDLTGGKQSFSGTIQVSDASYGAPSITLPDGWSFTTPPTNTNPNGDFPTWTFTAEAPLAAD